MIQGWYCWEILDIYCSSGFMCVNDKTSCMVLKQFSHRQNRLSMLIFILHNKVKFDLCTTQEELMVSLAFEGTLCNNIAWHCHDLVVRWRHLFYIKYILLVRHLGFVCVLLYIARSGLLHFTHHNHCSFILPTNSGTLTLHWGLWSLCPESLTWLLKFQSP